MLSRNVVEAQGLVDSRIDLVGAIQKRGVQHHQGEDNIDLLMALPNMYENCQTR